MVKSLIDQIRLIGHASGVSVASAEAIRLFELLSVQDSTLRVNDKVEWN